MHTERILDKSLQKRLIEVLPYDSNWPGQFLEEAKKLKMPPSADSLKKWYRVIKLPDRKNLTCTLRNGRDVDENGRVKNLYSYVL